jgi:hypothetical protein
MTLSKDEHQRWYRRIHEVLRDANSGFITTRFGVGIQMNKVRQDMMAVGHSSSAFTALRKEVLSNEVIAPHAKKLLKYYLPEAPDMYEQ